jgi:hypothetical protein
MLIVRLVITAGLVALGYYVGREVGRMESVRRGLEGSRAPRPPPEAAGAAGSGQPASGGRHEDRHS